MRFAARNADCRRWQRPAQSTDFALFVCSLLAVVLGFSVALAQEYTVEGMLVHTEHSVDGRSMQQKEQFVAMVSGNSWCIRESGIRAGKQIEKEASFDGTNFYQLLKSPPQPQQKGKPFTVSASGLVRSWDMPAPDSLFATAPLWLAYASASQFLTAADSKARPVWVLDGQELWSTGFKVSAYWASHPEGPFLPESIFYVDDGRTHPRDGSAPFVLGPAFTNVVYSAAFTNVGKIAVPASFLLTRLKMEYAGGAAGNIWLAANDEAVVTAITPSCKVKSFRPEASGVVLIADYRFEADPGYSVRYLVTNETWRIMPYAALVAMHEKETRLSRSGPTSPPWGKRNIIFWIMFLVTGGFGYALMRAGRVRHGLAEPS
jgi:hypothetical protein